MLSRIIPGCSTVLAKLDDTVAGCESKKMSQWTDDLLASFNKAQTALSSTHTISLPILGGQLWIVTDGVLCRPGIGATLYATRNDKLHLAGFFSAKLRGSQLMWLPCEVEALAIAVATKHFSPYLIQSQHKAYIFTDSKPCIQAYEKLVAILPGWPHSPNVLIYAAHTRIYNREHSLQRKLTNMKDVKKYVDVTTIAKDSLLVVKRNEPLAPTHECIVLPRQVLDGLLTAFHIQLSHPSSN